MVAENVTLSVDSFGTVEDHISKEEKQVKRFTWKNSKTSVSVQVDCLSFYFYFYVLNLIDGLNDDLKNL